jgi:glycerol-3-phosphate acyltransferase PlsY
MPWLLALVAYLLGSLSFAILLSRWRGRDDPRLAGSGNPGATNVLRLAGRRLAVLTLVLDMLKGFLPVQLAAQSGLPPQEQGWVALAAVLGHLYPLFFRFRGGKGVSTSAGVLLALCWPVALLGLACWLAVFAVTRISSLAALVATPLALGFLVWQETALAIPCLLICLLVYWRHRSNLVALWRGNERSFR